MVVEFVIRQNRSTDTGTTSENRCPKAIIESAFFRWLSMRYQFTLPLDSTPYAYGTWFSPSHSVANVYYRAQDAFRIGTHCIRPNRGPLRPIEVQ